MAKEGSFGKVDYNKEGFLEYVPLIFDTELNDIWGLFELENGSLILTFQNRIAKFNSATNELSYYSVPDFIENGKIHTAFSTPKGILMSVSYSDSSAVAKYGEGSYILFDYNNMLYSKIANDAANNPHVANIRSFFKLDGQSYIAIEGIGILPVEDDNESYQINFDSNNSKNPFTGNDFPTNIRIVKIKNERLWIGTENLGLHIYDLDGNLFKKFDNYNNLQDNFIYKILIDDYNNVFLALDNGISVIKLSSPVSYWDKNDGVIGAVESIEFFKNKALLSSRTKGVLNSYLENDRIKFSENEGVDEASFDLEVSKNGFDTSLLIVGYTGIWELDKTLKNANTIADIYAWKLFYTSKTPDLIYVGGEDFFGYLAIENGEWSYHNILNTDQEIRSVVYHNDYIYFGVRGEGIFKWNKEIEEPELLAFSDSLKFPRNTSYFLEVLENQLFVAVNGGLLEVKNDTLDYAVLKNVDFNKNTVNIHRIFEHPKENQLWAFIFIDKEDTEIKEFGYFKNTDAGLEWVKVTVPQIEKGIISDMKFHQDLLYFGSTNGLISFDIKKYNKFLQPWDIKISSVEVTDLNEISKYSSSEENLEAEFGKSVRFNFASIPFFEPHEIAYRTRLKGFSNEWSTFEKIPFKDFEKLPHGNYTLEVQGLNLYGKTSEIYKFDFNILPPWYFTTYAYISYLILLLFSIYLISKIAIYRVKQKNKLLEATVKERTYEIAKKNSMLENQKKEIELKNEDIMDSIKYAKRIQDTILPSKKRMDETLGDNFVFFKPKDIVSGDFYWVRKIDKKIYWSAIDCTGHGVPGALVSFVGNNGLQRATNEFELRKPSAILDKLRELVIYAFKNQGDNDVKDGMDMALVCYDKEKRVLSYSGAHNSLVIIRNGELIEIKADKQPIGYFSSPKPFTNHEIDIQKGDCIYLYSDGFVDQFGGDTLEKRENGGKKYKSKKFKRLLTEIHEKPMDEQKKIITKEFNSWKGDLEQLDDVCVIGVRL